MNDDVIGLSAVEMTKLFMVLVSTAARKDGESGSAIDLRGDSLIHCTWNVGFFKIQMVSKASDVFHVSACIPRYHACHFEICTHLFSKSLLHHLTV